MFPAGLVGTVALFTLSSLFFILGVAEPMPPFRRLTTWQSGTATTTKTISVHRTHDNVGVIP